MKFEFARTTIDGQKRIWTYDKEKNRIEVQDVTFLLSAITMRYTPAELMLVLQKLQDQLGGALPVPADTRGINGKPS